MAQNLDPLVHVHGTDYHDLAAAAVPAWWRGGAPPIYDMFGSEVRNGTNSVAKYFLPEGLVPKVQGNLQRQAVAQLEMHCALATRTVCWLPSMFVFHC